MSHKEFIKQFKLWSIEHNLIQGAAIVGSYARGEQNSESDIDVIFFSKNIKEFIDDTNWINRFGVCDKVQIEQYGVLTSVRCFYNIGIEVEFGIASLDWANIPIDKGTYKVVADGFKIIYDPLNRLSKLQKRVNKKDPN